MNAMYFWDGNQVLPTESMKAALVLEHGFGGMLCVDTFHKNEPHWRYGLYQSDPERLSIWKHIPLEDFPKEFRTHLLLLGVT